MTQRILWAVDILDVQPNDFIIEIGCGNGAAVSLICERLTTGRITAIDRSAKMTSLARRNNARNIALKKAVIKTVDLQEVAFTPASFDKIFLFNLNVFWMDPVAELAIVRRLLRPRGSFFIFHNPPPGGELAEYVKAISDNLNANGFVPDEPIFDHNVASLCIKSAADETHRS